MAIEHRFGEFASETKALQRALTYLQEHDRNTPSEETAEEVLGIAPPTTEQQELEASQRHAALLHKTEAAVNAVCDKFHIERPPADTSVIPPPASATRASKAREPGASVSISRHKRLCIICKHPDRDAIEEAFLQWRRIGDLRLEFNLPDRKCIRRHATALGLFEKRRRNMKFALDAIIEEAETVKPTADAIIRAIRAQSLLDDEGRWVDPPKQVIVNQITHVATPLSPQPPPRPALPPIGSAQQLPAATEPMPEPAKPEKEPSPPLPGGFPRR